MKIIITDNAMYIGEYSEDEKGYTFLHDALQIYIIDMQENGEYSFDILPIGYPINFSPTIINIASLPVLLLIDKVPSAVFERYTEILNSKKSTKNLKIN
jgi:hypothetical protein